jgi:hypothetical protein
MTDLNELGHKRDLIREKIVRLNRHPARVHGLSEEARTERLFELQDELRLLARCVMIIMQ